MAVSAEVFNKELEKKGELNDNTKAVELNEKDIKRIIDDFQKQLKYQSKLDMMELKFMEQIIT